MNFIFDIDGTLCFNGVSISEKILTTLFGLKEAGHLIGFASARHSRDIFPVIDERFKDCLLIGANGAVTYANQQLHHSFPIQASTGQELMRILDEYNATYLVDGHWNYAIKGDMNDPFVSRIDPIKIAKRVDVSEVNQFIKILVLSCEKIDEVNKLIEPLDVTIHHHSDEMVLDITSKDVNKMRAIEQYGITNDFICFGNDSNDIPMFERAAYSVMIGGHKELGQYAKHIIPKNDQLEENIVSKLLDVRDLSFATM